MQSYFVSKTSTLRLLFILVNGITLKSVSLWLWNLYFLYVVATSIEISSIYQKLSLLEVIVQLFLSHWNYHVYVWILSDTIFTVNFCIRILLICLRLRSLVILKILGPVPLWSFWRLVIVLHLWRGNSGHFCLQFTIFLFIIVLSEFINKELIIHFIASVHSHIINFSLLSLS